MSKSLLLNSRKKIVIKLLITLSLLAVFGLIIYSLGFELKKKNLSPEESSAIYGGSLENNLYPYAGYLIAYGRDDEASLCGLNYLSADLAITAAHCFKNKIIAYVGYSLFNFSKDNNFLVSDLFIHDGWDFNDLGSDLALVRLPEDFYKLEEYVQISTPKIGCDYEILGYGKTGEETEKNNLDKQRKKARVCIENVYETTFRVKGSSSGVCFGDSGSPIFKAGTNELVGILSSIMAPVSSSSEPCSLGNTAVAVRADVNKEFISKVEANEIDRHREPKCGEICLDNKCSYGLSCENSVCVNSNTGCIQKDGGFCSENSGIQCGSNSKCILNTCEGISLVTRFDSFVQENFMDNMGPELFEIRNYEESKGKIFVVGAVFIGFSIVLAFYESVILKPFHLGLIRRFKILN